MIRLVRYWFVGIEESFGFSFEFRVPDPLEYHTDSRLKTYRRLSFATCWTLERTKINSLQRSPKCFDMFATCFATCFAILVDQWWSMLIMLVSQLDHVSLQVPRPQMLGPAQSIERLGCKGHRGTWSPPWSRGVPWNIEGNPCGWHGNFWT